MTRETFKIIFTYLLLCFIWGSTWLAIRISLESFTPFLSGGLRFLIASVAIFIVMRLKGISLQKDKLSVKLYLQMGFLSFVIPFGLVYWAEQFVPSGLAAVLFGVYPFFVAIFSFFMIPNEKIGIGKTIGMIFGFAGIVVIFSDSFSFTISDYLLGMFAVMLSGIMQAYIAVTLKKYGRHLNPLSMNFIPMLIAGISGTLIGLFAENTSSISLHEAGIFAVLYLALFGSVVTFTAFYWLMKKINVVILSLIAFITPVVALILGWIFYNEVLTTQHLIGSAFVLIGLLIANLYGIAFQKVKEIKI
ncbi:DMT superfamily drug/metaboltie permease [Ignavibacterium album JCM 16511]|uniref:DMT superfamily drug/metaboltie permease n=1 Tax=Ignavibacterium album (strain DSM 19864 / JCM 16511 / NBRC 101810 / Mat9-16) TaxID=945713 RepID=I0AM74_IGNAJ|nr:EamA family transporter [Ignavibacterium album]AFH50081.1 DMT superfamily drug/metaboltie permease [Ignavibacterium album JCM 16511]